MPISGNSVEWIQQTDAAINQAAPIQNTWYTVLDYTGRYTWIHNIFIVVATANETLEMEVIIDGITYLAAPLAATFGTTYFAKPHRYVTVSLLELGTASPTLNHEMGFVGHNVRVRVRKTTAAGAGILSSKVVYAVK